MDVSCTARYISTLYLFFLRDEWVIEAYLTPLKSFVSVVCAREVGVVCFRKYFIQLHSVKVLYVIDTFMG